MSAQHRRVPRHRVAADGDGAGLGPQPHRRRLRALLGSTVAIAIGVAVGVAGSAGTYAAWNNSVTIPGGVIQTGSTTLEVAPQASGDYGSTAALGDFAQFPHGGGWSYTTFTVENTSTTTPVSVGLSGATSPSSAMTDPNHGLYSAVVMYLQPGDCPTDITTLTGSTGAISGGLGADFGSAAPLAADLAVGDTQLVCLAFHLPGSVGGPAQSLDFTLNLVGTQILS